MDSRQRDLFTNLAFALGLILLVGPDPFVFAYSSHAPKIWLYVSNSVSDAVLFTTVFFFLKREIRHRRTMNDRLADANRLKSQFLQIAAHDLRNPLNTISLLACEISAGKPDPSGKPFNPREEIRIAAGEMLGIIDGLLDAAAMEAGKIDLNWAYFDLTDCVNEIIERNRFLAERKGQRLEFSGTDGCVVEVDGTRVKQVIDNLVSNAIKFSPKGEPILVSLQCERGHARIEVRDRGPGLTDADKRGLFGRFQRLSARPTGGESSTGIGLANARQLVELHGGKIGGESDGPGRGSVFWVELPIGADARQVTDGAC